MIKTETTLTKAEGVKTIVDYGNMGYQYDANELAAIAASISLTIAHRINRAFRNGDSEITIPEIIQRISENMTVMEQSYREQQAGGEGPMLTQ